MTMTRGGLVAVVLALALAGTATEAGANEPVMEYGSLLNLRFYEPSGGFLIESLQIVFPPQTDDPLSAEVVTATGESVASNGLRLKPWPDFPAFAGVGPNGPGGVQIGKAGDYLMRIKLGDKVISELPFTIGAASSGDPFDPKTSYSLDGEWSQLAYLAARPDKPDEAVSFNGWLSLRDIDGAGRRASCSVAIVNGATPVAGSQTVVVSQAIPQFIRMRLRDPANRQNFSKANLLAADGNHEVQLICEGTTVRSYGLTVTGGAIQAHPRSALDYQPRSRFLSPRFIDTSAGSSSRYVMSEAWWIEALE